MRLGIQKGLVQRIERKLENTVGDAFARVFGGSIVPEEVEAALLREASDGVHTLQGGRFLAPNDYVITLSVSDFQKVSADRDLTTDTFARHLAGHIREQGWQTYGDVVVRFEQSESLHTGQYRARGVVNPDAHPQPLESAAAPPQSNRADTAEPGVLPMSDNSGHRGDPGQGRPADDYYDERRGRPQDDDPRGRGQERPPYPPDYNPNDYPPRGGYPDRGYGPGYDQRPPGGNYGPGYDPRYQNYRQESGRPDPGRQDPGYGDPYGPPQGGGYPGNDYGRGRPDPNYGRPDPRQPYPDQGYNAPYGRPDYGPPDYPRYEQGGNFREPAARDYDYGQPQAASYGGFSQGEYPTAGGAVTLQLDDGSGRTYQLREGANVIGRGQDAQFRLPDTGVSRRHLEIRWDGQVALLCDLNSTNGTTVNNAPVQEWQLADGDVIRLGHSEIIVRVH